MAERDLERIRRAQAKAESRRDAHGEGADMATIARVASLSRERVRQIVRK